MAKIAFAGTDGRTFWGALSAHFGGHEGIIVRGMPGMKRYVKQMGYPLRFIETNSTKTSDYVKTIIQAFKDGKIDYLIPMPEALQFDGVVDEVIAAGFGDKIAGFVKKSAYVEGDKIACKELCQEVGIKTANWTTIDLRDYKEFNKICRRFLRDYGGAVPKYPYSAGGKGARIINTDWDIPMVYDGLIKDYAEEYSAKFGDKGKWPILIEQKRAGSEISFLIPIDIDGNYCVLPTTMDFPERYDAPLGPDNPITGGLGAIGPHPAETSKLFEQVGNEIALPFIEQMKRLGILRPCIIYPGCIINYNDGWYHITVNEINIRIGEPEGPVAMRLVDNFSDLVIAMFTGELDKVKPVIRQNHLVISLCLFTGPGPGEEYPGYPFRRYKKGEPMQIDFDYLQKNKITIIPSGMGYSEEIGFYSDGTRICYLMANSGYKSISARADVARSLKDKLIKAYKSCIVRVIPEEDANGNRLVCRQNIGDQYELGERIFY